MHFTENDPHTERLRRAKLRRLIATWTEARRLGPSRYASDDWKDPSACGVQLGPKWIAEETEIFVLQKSRFCASIEVVVYEGGGS